MSPSDHKEYGSKKGPEIREIVTLSFQLSLGHAVDNRKDHVLLSPVTGSGKIGLRRKDKFKETVSISRKNRGIVRYTCLAKKYIVFNFKKRERRSSFRYSTGTEKFLANSSLKSLALL